MTQEEKDLLLKDLCCRLPYNCRVFYEYVDGLDGKTYGYSLTLNTWCIDESVANKAVIKPYLFPFSSMTEEQKNSCPISETNLNIINSNIGCYGIIEIPWKLSYLFVDWCNKNHFDYRDLIPMGSAIDATGLNIY